VYLLVCTFQPEAYCASALLHKRRVPVQHRRCVGCSNRGVCHLPGRKPAHDAFGLSGVAGTAHDAAATAAAVAVLRCFDFDAQQMVKLGVCSGSGGGGLRAGGDGYAICALENAQHRAGAARRVEDRVEPCDAGGSVGVGVGVGVKMQQHDVFAVDHEEALGAGELAARLRVVQQPRGGGGGLGSRGEEMLHEPRRAVHRGANPVC
jgi:hypothetical protein